MYFTQESEFPGFRRMRRQCAPGSLSLYERVPEFKANHV